MAEISPKKTLPIIEEILRDPDIPSSDVDFAHQAEIVEDLYNRRLDKVGLLPLASARSKIADGNPLKIPGVDDLYGDIAEREVLEEAIRVNVNCYVDSQPENQQHTQHGVDEQRDVNFVFAIQELRKLELVTPMLPNGIDIGDFVIWDETLYAILKVYREGYVGHTGRPLYVVCESKRHRFDNIKTTKNSAILTDENFASQGRIPEGSQPERKAPKELS